MGGCESASASPEAPGGVDITVERLPELDAERHPRGVQVGTQTEPPNQEGEGDELSRFSGEWLNDASGVEITVAPVRGGSLRFSTSKGYVALVRPQSDTYIGERILWNTGLGQKVQLRLRGGNLECQSWDVARKAWFAPQVCRPLSAMEAAATRGRFFSLETLWEELSVGHTVLIKGSWLQLQATAGVLPRRQDLPPGAAWEPTELRRAVEACTVRIVALSYCWKEADHPDPDGEQLRTVAGLIERRLAHEFSDHTRVLEDLAVFWDFPSLFQKPRTSSEQEAFEWGLQEVDVWYAHSSTETWLLTSAPRGTKAYGERGWPVFERAVCSLIKPADSFLDVGLWEGGHEAWAKVAAKCKAQREPPLRPKRATALLETKAFTSGADMEKVQRIYERTYYQVLGGTRCLRFANLSSWGDSAAEALAECLADCPLLQELDLNYDRIGAVGAAALGAAAAKCGRLRHVYMTQNPLGDKGVAALLEWLPRCPALETLSLTQTGVGDRGAEAIAAALPRCRALRNFTVARCSISDAGAKALGAAFAQCAALERLEIDDNKLSEGGRAALRDAWAKMRKPQGGLLV